MSKSQHRSLRKSNPFAPTVTQSHVRFDKCSWILVNGQWTLVSKGSPANNADIPILFPTHSLFGIPLLTLKMAAIALSIWLINSRSRQIRPLLDKLEENVCDGASDDALTASFKPYKHFAQDASQILRESVAFIDAAVKDLQVQVYILIRCVHTQV
jgi:hypothetical protein